MTLAHNPHPAGNQPDDSIRASDRDFAAFLAHAASHALRSKAERDRLEAIQRRARQAEIAAFTARQIKLAERLLDITEETA